MSPRNQRVGKIKFAHDGEQLVQSDVVEGTFDVQEDSAGVSPSSSLSLHLVDVTELKPYIPETVRTSTVSH